MMTKINVIDLDKTLIPYDSFRELILIRIKGYDLRVTFITILRVFRIISQKKFKSSIVLQKRRRYDDEFSERFAERIFNDIDQRVMNLVEKESDENTINVLLSASPHFYVKYLIHRLNWTGSGSYFANDKEFIHLYGETKVTWVQKKFPKEKYEYNLAISDSDSDNELLKLFKKEIKWILH
jgi:phosphoserine phosphatase